MNENNIESNFTPPSPQQKPKSNPKKVLVIIAIVLLALTAGTLTYLYFNEKNTNKELNQKVSSLEVDHSTMENTATEDKNETAPATEKVSYVAEVGKFSLSLPDNYRIVEYIDGAGEGGELTWIEIAKKSDKGELVVNNLYFDKLEIWAAPVNSYESLQSFVDSRIQTAESTRKDNTTIDGKEAQVYSVPGIDETFYYFIESKDAYIVITKSSADNDKFTDVLNGFSFVD